MRLFKFVFILLCVALMFGAYFYFSKSSSYQKAFQAKAHYYLGNYDEAYILSKSAMEEDIYNKMANTIFQQSQIAKAYLDFINEGNDYLAKIGNVSMKEGLSASDRERIKLMSEVVIEKYQFITPTPMTDPKLILDAKQVYEKFEKLHKELF